MSRRTEYLCPRKSGFFHLRTKRSSREIVEEDSLRGDKFFTVVGGKNPAAMDGGRPRRKQDVFTAGQRPVFCLLFFGRSKEKYVQLQRKSLLNKLKIND